MSEPRYTGPPPTGVYRAPPQYPPQYPPPYEPPYPLYPPYAGPPPDPRPSAVLAAAVLGWIAAGLLVLAAGLLFFGAAFLHGVEAGDGYVAEFSFDAIADVIAAGLLVAGGVALTGRSSGGRVMLSGGAAIVVLESVYWLARWTARTGGAVVGYALLFAALAVSCLIGTWSAPVSRWLAPH